MSNWNDQKLTLILTEVARRASVDSEFRSLALKDPRAAMQKVSPEPVPQSVEVKFLDNSGSVRYFPLPDPIPGLEELSDAELLAVAGGDYTITGSGGTGQAAAGGGWHR